VRTKFREILETLNQISLYLISYAQQSVSVFDLQKAGKFSYAGFTENQIAHMVRHLGKNPHIPARYKPTTYKRHGKNPIITRKFGIHINDKQERRQIREFYHMGIQLRNTYTKTLVNHLKPLIRRDLPAIMREYKQYLRSQSKQEKKRRANVLKNCSPVIQLLESTSSAHIKKHFWNQFRLKDKLRPFTNQATGGKSASLKNRFARCLFDEPFLAVREMMVRLGRLKLLIDFYKANSQQLGNLIADINLVSKQLVDRLSRTILGEEKKISFAYAENYIRQLRNLLLEITEFYNSELTSAPYTGKTSDKKAKLRHELITFITGAIKVQKGTPSQFKQKCMKAVLDNLAKTPLQIDDLLDKLKRRFLSSIKHITTKMAKNILQNKRRIQKISAIPQQKRSVKKKKALKKATRLKAHSENQLTALLGFSSFRDLEQFKTQRQTRLAQFSARYNAAFSTVQKRSVATELLHQAADEELQMLSPQSSINLRVLKRLFNPRESSKYIPEVSIAALQTYAKNHMKTLIRNNLKRILFSRRGRYSITALGDQFRAALDLVEADLPDLLDHISFSKSSHSTGNDDGQYFNINYKHKEIRISPINIRGSKEYVFPIKDTKHRMDKLIDEGAIPLAPTISEVGAKLILNQPFRVAIKDIEIDPNNIMGIDLGLKVFGVASVIDNQNKRIYQHFLKENLLFNRSIDPQKRKKKNSHCRSSLVKRFGHLHSATFSNVKGKLVNLRKEWQHIQRKIDLEKTYHDKKYEKIQELLKNAPITQLRTLESTLGSIIAARKSNQKPYHQFLTTTIIPQLQADSLGAEIDHHKLNLSELRRLKKVLKLINVAKTKSDKEEVLSSLTPIYAYKSEYNRLVRIRKRINARMQHIHEEIAHQFAHHVIELAKCYRVGLIKFEDLRWSKHQKKEEAGHYLSTWQIH